MSILSRLEAWWLVLWHHFIHGTLPEAPTLGGAPVAVPPIAPTTTPIAPALPTLTQDHIDTATANNKTPMPVIPRPPIDINPPPGPVPVLESTPQYATTGTEPAPGVTVVDAIHGLVAIKDADAIYPGQRWACPPLMAILDKNSEAYATVAYNCAYAKAADEGFAMHARVQKMVAVANPDALSGLFANSNPIVWLDDAWSIGAEFDTWDKAIARAVFQATNLAKGHTGGSGSFVPGT